MLSSFQSSLSWCCQNPWYFLLATLFLLPRPPSAALFPYGSISATFPGPNPRFWHLSAMPAFHFYVCVCRYRPLAHALTASTKFTPTCRKIVGCNGQIWGLLKSKFRQGGNASRRVPNWMKYYSRLNNMVRSNEKCKKKKGEEKNKKPQSLASSNRRINPRIWAELNRYIGASTDNKKCTVSDLKQATLDAASEQMCSVPHSGA